MLLYRSSRTLRMWHTGFLALGLWLVAGWHPGARAQTSLFAPSGPERLAWQPVPQLPLLRTQLSLHNLQITPEQLAIAARRHRLSPQAKLECSSLDTRLPQLERSARRAKPAQKPEAEQQLLQARQRFYELRC